MHSTYSKGKSVAAERFVRTLKNKIFKLMTVISKNVYFDPLDNIVNKYNDIVHRTIKIKPTSNLHLILTPNTMKIQIKKIINLKLEIMLEFQNIKTFLLKDTLLIDQKKLLLLVKLKIQFVGLMLLVT